jgi:hypothetical protein
MMVLDVTGSMANTTSDGKTRIAGLKDASMVFFDTLTQAEKGDGRLRIGIVPYSNSANVGRILREKNPAWLSNYTILPSRSPVIRYNWSGTNPPTSVTTGTTTNGAWADFLPASGFTETTACSNLTAPADTMPALTTGQDMNKTAYIVDAGNVRRYVTVAGAKHAYFNYRYNYNTTDSTCWLQRAPVTSIHFVRRLRPSISYRTDRILTSRTERGTTPSTRTAPALASGWVRHGALHHAVRRPDAPPSRVDMDIDLVPTPTTRANGRCCSPKFPRVTPRRKHRGRSINSSRGPQTTRV